MMRTMMAIAVMLTLCCAMPASAQRFGGGRNSTEVDNVAYDGRFVYARLQYTPASFNGFGRGDPMWNHDYPRADRTFPQILWAKTVHGGSKPMQLFQATATAQSAPTVDFAPTAPAAAPAPGAAPGSPPPK